jgi:hypothetical protein
VAELRIKAAYNPHRLMDDKYRYMHWLEEMWEVHKFDIPGRTQREERKKEETLEMFRGLVKLSKHAVDPPDFPPWERSLW